jgi:hypothetical protein
MKRIITIILCVTLTLLVAGCSGLGQIVGGAVPTTGDTQFDPSAAQRFIPNLTNYGYTATDAANITSAISSLGGSASLLTGDPVVAGVIAQIDSMITCYRNVGAVAARIYTPANLGSILQGQVPSLGVLAVINTNRVADNLLQCALGGNQVMGAQSATLQPCAGSGSFVRDNETLTYVFAATDQNLCQLFTAAMPTS